MNMLNKLQHIDRRILYVLMVLVISVPLFIRPGKHPKVIMSEVTNAYNTLNNIPKNKIVLISDVWGAGTVAENGPQTEVIVRHLFQRGTKFAIVSWDQVGNQLTYDIVSKVAHQMGKKYGTDWVHLGYQLFYPQVVLRGMAENFPKVMQHDRFGTNLSKLPAVANVKGYKDIGAVVEISPSGTMESWLAYFCGPYNVKLIFCPTAVMAAEAYPYIDSGQLSGMLNGVIGAFQYESLIGMKNARTDAAATSWALSSAHIFILFLIVLGNIAYLMSKHGGQQRSRGGN